MWLGKGVAGREMAMLLAKFTASLRNLLGVRLTP